MQRSLKLLLAFAFAGCATTDLEPAPPEQLDQHGQPEEGTVGILGPPGAPTVTITAPGGGATVGTTVTLSGIASDAEDGTISGSIQWSSNVAGALGSGASRSVTLASGVHIITATITDSSGLSASSTVSITVSTAPLFSDNFEGTLSWTVTGLWHKVTNSTCASPGYSSAVGSLYYGQNSTCNFSTGATTVGTATSTTITGVSSTSSLSFKYFRRVESASGNFDVTSVEVVSGAASTTVWSRNSSNASTTTWQSSAAISLAAFAGQSIQLRLRFDSKDSLFNAFTGWLVDDIVVTR